MREGDKLAESSQKLTPLAIMQRLPPGSEIELSDLPAENELLDGAVNMVYSLLYTDADKGVGLAYSEQDGCWHKVVESPADDYDPDIVEEQTHQFVIEHKEGEIDEHGFMS